MDLIRIDPDAPDDAAIARAAALLRAGRLVAFPTETVYGLGANALDPIAIERLYAAKGRPAYNPIIVHVASLAAARELTTAWPDAAERLGRSFWPGPLTLVLPKRDEIPDSVTAGLRAVAVRVPAHPVALALLRAAAIPIAAPSANRSTRLSPTTAAHVAKSLGDAVDLILDGGPTTVGIESTVVDLTSLSPRVLRPGMISASAISDLVGALATTARVEGDAPRPSPGMLDRHYAPRARVELVDQDEVAPAIARHAGLGQRVGAVVISAPAAAGTVIRLSASPAAYAARVYDALHSLDDAGCDVIIAERVPDGADWDGVRDRLRRAATPSTQDNVSG